MASLIDAFAQLPAQRFAAGDAVVREGDAPGPLWLLESGTLDVIKGGVPVNTITQPGALVGEVSVLLGRPVGATVVAREPCVLRHAPDGRALLGTDPELTRLVAAGLAERLNAVTTYLADLKQQYGEAPGLAMVAEVLGQLAQRPAVPVRPGSAREPDPEY
jgi:CRP-like cAMP-binding protein